MVTALSSGLTAHCLPLGPAVDLAMEATTTIDGGGAGPASGTYDMFTRLRETDIQNAGVMRITAD